MPVRPGELRAQQRRFHSAEEEENKRRDDVTDAKLFVIDGRKSGDPVLGSLPQMLEATCNSRLSRPARHRAHATPSPLPTAPQSERSKGYASGLALEPAGHP